MSAWLTHHLLHTTIKSLKPNRYVGIDRFDMIGIKPAIFFFKITNKGHAKEKEVQQA
jgi:hypothetical protein